MVRTRFAPSPTGYLHIGGVRTALFNWLYARQHQGQFIVRIDDTDQQRNIQEALQPILDGFRWLGIEWDEGPEVGGPYAPYFQSQRQTRYQEAVQELLTRGHAYRDFARPEELQAERAAAEQAGRSFLYSRRWMAESDEQAGAFAAESRSGVVRLKMPRSGICRFDDLIRGTVEFAWQQEQDHVIQRADGSCLYHLASVVDDYDYQITHIIRAVEHLSNTPRQIFIAQGLGYPLPAYAHLPYVAAPGSSQKLSKRKLREYLKNPDFRKLYDHGLEIMQAMESQPDEETFNPVIVDFYRQVGFLPDAIVNYLLLLGWSLDDRTEYFTRDEMVRHFTLERVSKSPAAFDPQKLAAFQMRYMQSLPVKQKVARTLPYLQEAKLVTDPPPCNIGPKLMQVVTAAGDRLKVAGDILNFSEFFVPDQQLQYDEKAFEKRLASDPQAAHLLAALRQELAEAEPFEAPILERLLHEFVERQGIKIGQIIHALRVAVTGKAVGLGMFDCLAILGREQSLSRIDRALEKTEARKQKDEG